MRVDADVREVLVFPVEQRAALDEVALPDRRLRHLLMLLLLLLLLLLLWWVLALLVLIESSE
jgi:hypothetical protein